MMKPSVAAKTSPTINPDPTRSGKEHFEVFGWLRGSGLSHRHLSPLHSFGWNAAVILVREAYLAVDFFSGLSGFVVAYTYCHAALKSRNGGRVFPIDFRLLTTRQLHLKPGTLQSKPDKVPAEVRPGFKCQN
jgi:hypothetical protein